MPAFHRANILAEIRKGKRSWSHLETGGNLDVFRTRVVEPLRQLKYDGILQALSEVESLIDGKMVITNVSIIGAANVQGEAQP